MDSDVSQPAAANVRTDESQTFRFRDVAPYRRESVWAALEAPLRMAILAAALFRALRRLGEEAYSLLISS